MTGAKGIAISFGINEFIVGATIVAVGTSVPELATVIIAKLSGHEEVSLGTILGSNIFNGLFIVVVAAVIYPISVSWREVAVALVLGSWRWHLRSLRAEVLLNEGVGCYCSCFTLFISLLSFNTRRPKI